MGAQRNGGRRLGREGGQIMTEIQRLYAGWIEENLDYVEKLKKDAIYWQGILEKRVFDGTWPRSIQSVIECFKSEIVKEIEGCHYHLQQVRENKDAEPCQKQS